MTAVEERWDAKVASERLAERLADVLDFVGRVDQAVTTGDLHYLADKGRALLRSVQRMLELTDELIDEDTDLNPHLPLVEDYLQRSGELGYRVIAALHPLDGAR